MAIPTLPGIKRRGIGKEVEAFAKAFASTFTSLNRGSRSGSARDTGPYSDKAVEDQDPRLSKGIFGGLFGSNTDNLTPYEQGMLRQQALYDLAVKRGDPEAIDRARTNMAKLNQLYDKGLIAKPGESFKATGYDNTGGTPPQNPEQPASALPVQSFYDNTPATYNYGNDYIAPQEFARGGPVGVPSAIPQGTIAPPADEEEEFVDYTNSTPNYINGRPDYNQGVEPTGPVEFSPEDLENPEALTVAAAQAVDAGYRTLSQRLQGNAALPNEDSDYQANVRSYVMGEGRMTDEEIAAIDKAIDPNGTMPRAQRSAARMAEIYKYYKDQGDEDTANDVAARLVQYNEFAGQTRAQLATQAIQQGKIQEGVKLLSDAYEDNVPDGKSVKTTVNPDNSVTVAIGYERRGEDGRISLAPEMERTIPLSELPQVAGYLTEQGKRLIMDVGAKANARAAGGTTGGGDLQKSLDEVRSAGDALRAAQRSGNEDEIAKAQSRVDAAVTAANRIPLAKSRTGNQDAVAEARRRNIAAALGAVGAPATTTGTSGKGTAEERAAAAAAAEKARLDKRSADIAEDVSYPGAIRESEQDELARRKQTQVDLQRLAMGAKNNPPEALKPKERRELYAGISEAADSALGAQFNLPDAEKKDDKKATLTKDQRNVVVDAAFDVARRNDLSEEQAARAVMGMMRGSLRPNADGMIQAGQYLVAVDPQTVRAIAAMRPGLQSELKRVAAPAPTASSSTAGQTAASVARGVAGTIEAIPSMGGPTAPYTTPELARQPQEAPAFRVLPLPTPQESRQARAEQPAVALQSEMRMLQNRVSGMSGTRLSPQDRRSAQDRIDELQSRIDAIMQRSAR